MRSSSPRLGRRAFLASSASAALIGSLTTLATHKQARARNQRWGALIPDPEGVFDLPAGFTYKILEDAGQVMDDGFNVPGRPDGMACFAGPNNTLILMRNHENGVGADPDGPYLDGQAVPPEAYDPASMGGVTRVVLDADTYERLSSNLVLVGSARNCAGGPSPWGWLSCEENVETNGEIRHGYTFVCPIDASVVQPPQRVTGYGRFNHEAVAIDPSNYYAYLTEDRIDGCLYRFVPDDMSDPFTGKLQALKVVGMDGYNTGLAMTPGEVLEVEWVDIDNPDPDDDSVRDEAQSKGAAIVVRGEGIWFFEGQVYVCSTSGGPIFKGQIFRLIDSDTPTLELIVQSTDATVLDNPDNITVAPWGDVFLVEDGDGDQYIRWITADGEVCDFGRNAFSGSELAGVCFSPDGGAMFVNIQANGLTLVITGPFPGHEPVGDGDGDNDGDTTGDGDGDSTGDEAGDSGDTGETGAGGETGDELGQNAEGDGCSCSTADGGDASGLVVTAAAALGLAALLRSDDDAVADR